MNNRYICGSCRQAIQVDSSAMLTAEPLPGIRCDYFACPNCGRKYVYLVSDARLRQDMRRLQDMKERRRASGRPILANAPTREDQRIAALERANRTRHDNLVHKYLDIILEWAATE